MEKYKLLIHVNELERWNITLANITNFINEIDSKDYKLIIVVQSTGVKGLLDERLVNIMDKLHSDKVIFEVCNNSLLSQKVSSSELRDYVKVVPIGIIEITTRQNLEGFAYMKP